MTQRDPSREPSPFRSARSSPLEREEKREALLLAAVRMFNERGFHAASLEDVAASVGVTKPVIYQYLGNKDQVLFECVRIGLEELRDAAAAARLEAGSGLDRLEAFLRRYSVTIMGAFGQCVIRTGDEALSPDSRAKFRALKRQIDDDLRRAIEDAVDDGSARVGDARMTALAFSGALNWAARWYRPDGQSTPEELAAGLVDVLINGIRP
jgi:AcrR family transcriptional regulator